MYGGSGSDMITFNTSGSSAASIERMRIRSNGDVILGPYDAPGSYTTAANNVPYSIKVAPYGWQHHSELAAISMGNHSGATGNDDGEIVFKTTKNAHSSTTGLVEKLRITSDGKLILSGTARTSPFIVGDGGMCIEQSYDGNLRAITIRNKDTDAARYIISFSLNRSGGDYDFVSGEIKSVKEQSWTTTDTTIDSAMVFSTTENNTLTERLRITSDGNVGIGINDPTQKLHIGGGKIRQRGPSLTNLNQGDYYAFPTGRTISANQTKVFTFSGLQSGWMTIRGGGYSSAGQSQFSVMYHLGGYMTATHTYDVHTVRQWGSGVSISTTKNAQNFQISITNNSGSYSLTVHLYVEGSGPNQTVSSN